MKGYRIIVIIVCTLYSVLCTPLFAQKGQNRPYVDDKRFHFGFQLGLKFSAFGVTDSERALAPDPLHPDSVLYYHARVGSLLPGFNVGFITDVRLHKNVNLRFCPGLQFSSRTISYKAFKDREGEEEVPVQTVAKDFGNQIDVLAIPMYLPLYLKFSADREGNYRPYVIAGGGVAFNVSHDADKPIYLNVMDYFCEVGFGVDLYFRWFKFCPEITYRIGFADQLCPSDKHPNLSPYNTFYTDAISRLTNHSVCLTFNFE